MNNTHTAIIRPANSTVTNEAHSHYLNAVRAMLDARRGYDGDTQTICDADADALAAAVAAYNKSVSAGYGAFYAPYNDALGAI